MKIRFAVESDLPAIVDIYNQAVSQRGATADLSPVTVGSRQKWFADHNQNSWPIWVAESDQGILGWCSLSAYRPGRMALRHTAEISYYVHESHRRRGIGSNMIQHAIDQCSALHFRSLFTLLLDINVSSIKILENFGFARWGHMPDVAEVDGKRYGHLIYGKVVE
jgi:phosphinothricin acetyltransferase